MGIINWLLLGLATGVFAGFFGLGGGVVLIPALVYFMDMSQHKAQGTTLLALIPPVGLLAAWRYWKAGVIGMEQVPVAAWIAFGILVGGLAGAHAVQYVDDALLKRIFGFLVVAIGLKMVIRP